MKLSLSSQDGLAVLTGSGEISTHDVDILKAGVTKLLRSGRNRMVLEFPEAEKIPPEIIRELSKLDLLARELSGRIVLAGTSEVLRTQINRFAEPPVIQCFDGREAAIQHLRPPATKPIEDEAALKAAAKAADEALLKKKSEIRQKEITDLTELRKRVSHLENENALLKNQLHASILAQKVASTEAVQQRHAEALKQKLEELLASETGAS